MALKVTVETVLWVMEKVSVRQARKLEDLAVPNGTNKSFDRSQIVTGLLFLAFVLPMIRLIHM